MLMLSWILKLYNHLFFFFIRPPPFFEMLLVHLSHFKGGSFMDKYLKLYCEMISLRGLSDHTLISYSTYIRTYLNYLDTILKKLPEDVTWDEMRDYIRWLQRERNLADRTINAAISQLRFFTIYVLHKNWDDSQLPKRRFETYLPFVPSQKDAFLFIDSIPDLKQKAMLALMYSAGLRVGEVCHLRYDDISRSDMKVRVRHSKNKVERFAPLSRYALDVLTQYWFQSGRPMGWLFPKQTDPDRPIDTFFLSRHIHKHEDLLGWPRRLTCHSFRHALGTHLYENGTDILTIKSILGHKSLNSTLIYVHLASTAFSSVENPLDMMGGTCRE